MTILAKDDEGRVWQYNDCVVTAMTPPLGVEAQPMAIEFEKLVAEPERPRDPT